MNIQVTEAVYNLLPSAFGTDKKVVLECDSASNAILINLPTISGLDSNDLEVEISDVSGSAGTYNITINAGGSNKINGVDQDLVINTAYGKAKVDVLSSSNWGGNYPAVGVILPAGVTAVHYGDGKNFTSVLTLDEVDLGETTNASIGIGALVMTLPAGSQIIKASKINISLVGDAPISADTPDVGLGSVIATGEIAALSDDATFEDILTGQTAGDTDGSAVIKSLKCTTSPFELITEEEGSKDIHLNVACAWAGISATVLASGTITINWSVL